MNKSSPKSFKKSISLPPRQRMHSPKVCASCTMCNVTKLLWNITEALQKHYEALRNIMQQLQSISECSGALRSIIEALWNVTGALQSHYRTLRKRCGSVMGCCGALQNITERCRMFQHVTKSYESVTNRYETFLQGSYRMLWNVVEPLQKISIMPITN